MLVTHSLIHAVSVCVHVFWNSVQLVQTNLLSLTLRRVFVGCPKAGKGRVEKENERKKRKCIRSRQKPYQVNLGERMRW